MCWIPDNTKTILLISIFLFHSLTHSLYGICRLLATVWHCTQQPDLNSCSLYLSLLLVCLAAFSGPALVGGLEEGPVPDSLPISRKVILLNIQVTFPFLAGKNKTVLVLLNITVYNLSALTEIIYILQQFYVQKLC